MTTLPDDWCAEHLQIEQDDERLWTTSELIFAAYLAGFVSVMVTLGLAFCWSFWL